MYVCGFYMSVQDIPAHAAFPWASAAGGGGRGLVGPAIVGALQVPNHLQKQMQQSNGDYTMAKMEMDNIAFPLDRENIYGVVRC